MSSSGVALISERLAQFASSLRYEVIPAAVRERAKYLVLDAIGIAGTCEQISEKSALLGIPVRKYNTNRALKSAPEFAERVKRSDHLLQYKLTARGQRLLDLLSLIDKSGAPDKGAGPKS